MRRAWIAVTAIFAVFAGGPAGAYSGGPTFIVTDLTTACASCHSSMQREQVRVEKETLAAAQLVEGKHYKAIEEGRGGYKDMSPEERQKLLADVKLMDQNASVTVTARPLAAGNVSVAVAAAELAVPCVFTAL